jgi:HEAT repeats
MSSAAAMPRRGTGGAPASADVEDPRVNDGETMSKRSSSIWIGAVVVVALLTLVVWLRPRPAPEAPVPAIHPAHRDARVEDRLNELRTEWARRSEHGAELGQQKAAANKPHQPVGEITERQLPRPDLPTPPAAAVPAGEPGKDAIDQALAANPFAAEPTLENLKPLALSDPDPQTRITAVLLLGTLDQPGAVAVLAQAVHDEDSDVRLMAIQALSGYQGSDAVQAVQPALSDPSPEVRFEALGTLAQIGGPAARDAVKTALNDDNDDVKALAQGILDLEDVPSDVPLPGGEANAQK